MRPLLRVLVVGVAVALVLVGGTSAGSTTTLAGGPLLAFVRSGAHPCEFPPDGSLNPSPFVTALAPVCPSIGGEGPHPPVPGGGQATQAAPLPDQIYVIRPDGGALRRLGAGVEPSWSPEGTKLAYVSDSQGLVVRSVDRAAAPVVIGGPAGSGPVESPSWSPDGSRIVFSSIASSSVGCTSDDPTCPTPPPGPSGEQLFLVNSNGRRLRQLTTAGGSDHSPVFTRDGRQIAYAHWGAASGIWLINPNGTDARRLVAVQGWAFGLAWSPDGKTLAFALVKPPYGAADSGIYLVNSDGSDLREVVATSRPDLNSPARDRPNIGLDPPAWMPDGSQITYTANGSLHAVDPDGSNDHLIATAPWPIYQPAWEPSPRFLSRATGPSTP